MAVREVVADCALFERQEAAIDVANPAAIRGHIKTNRGLDNRSGTAKVIEAGPEPVPVAVLPEMVLSITVRLPDSAL